MEELLTINPINNLTDQFIYKIESTINELDSTAASSVEIQLKLYDVLIPLFGSFIITLNLLVVISSGLILKKGQQPRSTYLFLGNVALSDLVTGIAVIFGQLFPSERRNETICSVQIGMIVSSTITSVYSVGLIAIDRFLYILYGLQYQRWVYPNRARLLISVTWIIGAVVGFLPAMGWRGDTDNGRVCWFIILAPPELVLLTTIVGFLPLLLIFILYGIILYHALVKVMQLKKATANINGTQTTNNLRVFRGGQSMQRGTSTATIIDDQNQMSETEEPLQPTNRFLRFFSRKPKKNIDVKANTGKSPSKWKAIKVVMYTTGSFTITWVPYFIASCLFVNCDPNQTPEYCNSLKIAIASPLAILGFMNSLFNPIIYAWWHNGFRESVKKIWRGLCCQGNENNTSTQPQTSRVTNTTTGSSPNVSDNESVHNYDMENTRPSIQPGGSGFDNTIQLNDDSRISAGQIK